MPSKAEKLLEKARNNKSGWMPHELISLYEGFGFIIRDAHGSHRIASHPDFPGNLLLRQTFPVHSKELPKPYVAKAVKAIDELLRLQKERNEND